MEDEAEIDEEIEEALQAAEDLRKQIYSDVMSAYWKRFQRSLAFVATVCFFAALPSAGSSWFWFSWLVGPAVYVGLSFATTRRLAKVQAFLIYKTVMESARRKTHVNMLMGRDEDDERSPDEPR